MLLWHVIVHCGPLLSIVAHRGPPFPILSHGRTHRALLKEHRYALRKKWEWWLSKGQPLQEKKCGRQLVITFPEKSCILFPLGFPLIIKNPTLSTFISSEGALVAIPLPLFHITSSRTSKSLYNLLTHFNNFEHLCQYIFVPLWHWQTEFLMTISDDKFWWQFLMTIYDDNFWWQFQMTISDENFWWKFLMNISDDNFWWKFLMTISDDSF